MSECSSEQYILCNTTGRNCDRKLTTLDAKAAAINDHTASLLEGSAERRSALLSETNVRIDAMYGQQGLDASDFESTAERQKITDDVEIELAELDASRPIATVGCDGISMLGRCGAYLTEEQQF